MDYFTVKFLPFVSYRFGIIFDKILFSFTVSVAKDLNFRGIFELPRIFELFGTFFRTGTSGCCFISNDINRCSRWVLCRVPRSSAVFSVSSHVTLSRDIKIQSSIFNGDLTTDSYIASMTASVPLLMTIIVYKVVYYNRRYCFRLILSTETINLVSFRRD